MASVTAASRSLKAGGILLVTIFALLPLGGSALASPGDRDSTFGEGGVVDLVSDQNPNVSALSVAVGPDGSTFVLRSDYTCSLCSRSLFVVRYRPDGSQDGSFFGDVGGASTVSGSEGVSDFAVDSRGRPIVMSQSGEEIVLIRLTREGFLDESFGPGGVVKVGCGCAQALALATDRLDRILIVGHRASVLSGIAEPPADDSERVFFARLLEDGSLDPSYGPAGAVATTIAGFSFFGPLALQPDGAAVLSVFPCCKSLSAPHFLRVGASGRFDWSFARRVERALDALVGPRWDEVLRESDLLARPDGRLDFVGSTFDGDGFVIRLLPNGKPDLSFGDGGLRWTRWEIDSAALDRRGRIVALGFEEQRRGQIAFRLRGDGRMDRTFGGGRGVILRETESFSAIIVGMALGKRPVIFDPGDQECRGNCPPKPLLLRLRGGSSRVRCLGLRATIVGTRRGEVLVGTKGRDVIAALGGVDVVRGSGGDDLICGGAGFDDLVGGPGRDRVHQ